MPIATHPEWQQLALYALVAAVVLTALFSIPKVGALLRGAVSIGVLAFGLFILFQQAPFNPTLSGLMDRAGLDTQEVVGEEVRIRMARDGHFWAMAEVNDVERRMLVDSGATVTTISDQTAQAAAIDPSGLAPVVLRTAGGTIAARTGEIDRLSLGTIEASNLKVVVAATPGGLDVLGMNFLSDLASWRVEGRTLILTPHARSAEERPTVGAGASKRS